MQQVRAGVAVFFFKTGKQLAARGVAAAAQIHAVITGVAERTVYASAQANGGFGHTDHQHRAGQVGGDFGRQRIEACRHQRRPRRDMPAQHTGNE